VTHLKAIGNISNIFIAISGNLNGSSTMCFQRNIILNSVRQHNHFILLLLLRWRYSPGWALASFTIRLQASRSLALSLHSFIPIFLRFVDTSSSHLIFGLPLRLVAYSFPYKSFLELWCLAFFLQSLYYSR